MLASTVQFSSYGRSHLVVIAPPSRRRSVVEMVRCEMALSVTEPPAPSPQREIVGGSIVTEVGLRSEAARSLRTQQRAWAFLSR